MAAQPPPDPAHRGSRWRSIAVQQWVAVIAAVVIVTFVALFNAGKL